MVSSRPVSLCVLVFTLVVAGGMASARTINVSAGQSIQNAINTAIKGDIIVVAKGRYRECIDFKGKAITVQSTKPADKTVVAATIIDGDKKGSVVTFKSGETSQTALRGLTITNGRGTGFPFYLDDYEYYGGGVYCESSSPTLNLNIIISNSAMSISHDAMHPRYGNGGGVYCKGGSPTLTSNTINNNSTNGSGGGVHCTGSSPTLTGNAILGNSATNGSGGGVYCSGGSPILSDNTIRGNGTDGAYPGGSGGGVCCVGGKPSLIKNTISGNRTEGMYGFGGGVYCSGASGTLSNNNISENYTKAGGGGVCLVDGSKILVDSNAIASNSASGEDGTGGGGVYCLLSSVTITNNAIFDNSVAADGYIFSGPGKGYGGGIYCDQASASLTNNIISRNSATGAMGSYGEPESYGGGICCGGAPQGYAVALTNNTLAANAATYGGGVCYLPYDGSVSSLTIKNTIIAFNTRGGGIYVDLAGSQYAKLTISYADIYGNSGDYIGWPNQTGKNGNISKDPLFAWAAKGNFYEKSKGGRWNLGTKTWVIDTVHSPCIDAGAPASPFANEPSPNGGRTNMRAYGNTKYASKSAPKGAASGLLLTATAASTGSGSAQITVNLTSAATVQVSVLNLAGREVAVLPEEELDQGVSTLLWNGRSSSGTRAPAGRYLVRVTARSDDGGQSQALAGLSLGR